MKEKIFNKIKNNLNTICITMFLISLLFSTFNLFTGLCNTIITTISFIVLGIGFILMIYDTKRNKKL